MRRLSSSCVSIAVTDTDDDVAYLYTPQVCPAHREGVFLPRSRRTARGGSPVGSSGFGRTGWFLSHQHSGDVICVEKHNGRR